MPELPDLPSIEPSNVTNDDLLLIYDVGAPSQPARKVTLGTLLASVARKGPEADVQFREVTAENISAPVASADTMTVTKGLYMGSRLERILSVTGPISMAAIAANGQLVVTAALGGAVVGDTVLLQPLEQLPKGLILQGYVLAADVVTITAFNDSTASIDAAARSLRVTVLRIA